MNENRAALIAKAQDDTLTRFSKDQPAMSKWFNGWLLNMTNMQGFVMVWHPGGHPFVLTREQWDALPNNPPMVNSDYDALGRYIRD